MIRPIMKSQAFLREPSQPAGPADAAVAQDLLETLAFHKDHCVGMAANMIGVRKRIIAICDGERLRAFYNPEIVSTAAPYQTEEGCLSLEGQRPATRYKRLKLRYLDQDFKPRTEAFSGFTAQIIQHEVDHCNGIII